MFFRSMLRAAGQKYPGADSCKWFSRISEEYPDGTSSCDEEPDLDSSHAGSAPYATEFRLLMHRCPVWIQPIRCDIPPSYSTHCKNASASSTASVPCNHYRPSEKFVRLNALPSSREGGPSLLTMPHLAIPSSFARLISPVSFCQTKCTFHSYRRAFNFTTHNSIASFNPSLDFFRFRCILLLFGLCRRTADLCGSKSPR